MAAVLRAAVEDACDVTTRKNAMAYVDSTDRRWPFSFENLCEALDIDPGDVRRQLGLGDPGMLYAASPVTHAKAPVPFTQD
jgi:hypothetical protein